MGLERKLIRSCCGWGRRK